MDSNLLLSIVFGAGVFLAFIGLDLIISSRTIRLAQRIDTYKSPVDVAAQAAQGQAKKERRSGLTSQGLQRSLADELARANLPLTTNEYLALNAATTVLGLIIGLVFFRNLLILVLVCGLIGFVAPRWYLRYLQGKRIAAFNDQISGNLNLLSNALRSGYGLSQAIDTVANESAPPSSVEFRRVGREVAIGLTLEAALDNLLKRNPSLDLELVVMAIAINRQSGGNLSEVFDQIANTIRERTRLQGELRSLTSQQRFTAIVLTALPPGLMAVIYIVNPDYISQLWQNSCGWIMLGAGGVLMVIGYFVIQKIMAIKF